ncbi:hypothetical protein EUTSA_v10010888mg [Eutrema salsugineum]|uniref:Uncharacterized protein n=1 Tax=Eutrema salsugineum TaxID=72664 RepID=V4LNT9_EUTSA|nr:hypothetical protein EUTSA_v10010888mg [Eutrema salsugineum]
MKPDMIHISTLRVTSYNNHRHPRNLQFRWNKVKVQIWFPSRAITCNKKREERTSEALNRREDKVVGAK